MTLQARVGICFRCGSDSDMGLRFGTDPTVVGACQKCFDEIPKVRREDRPRDYRTLDQLRGEQRR